MRESLSDLAYLLVDEEDIILGERLVAQMAGSGLPASEAAFSLVQMAGESAPVEDLFLWLDNTSSSDDLDVFKLVIHALVVIRVDFGDRPSAVAAREALSIRAESVYAVAGDVFGPDVFSWLVGLVGEAVEIISELAATSVPLIRVEDFAQRPSAALAYALYGDANRAGDLVARNGVFTPARMPEKFVALAS